MWSYWYEFYWRLLDYLFPPRCAGCEEWGERFCVKCLNRIDIIKDSICQRCGDPKQNLIMRICHRCTAREPYFDGIRSWANYDGPIQKAIQKLKYRRDIGLASTLAKPLLDLFIETKWTINLITAVPIDQQRFEERGYNQAILLARPIAWRVGTRLEEKALVKIRNTSPQVGLTITERMDNLNDAFEADPVDVKGKCVLIVDDVVTTGSTINACSAALKAAGAVSVYGISLARSLRLQGASVKMCTGGFNDFRS